MLWIDSFESRSDFPKYFLDFSLDTIFKQVIVNLSSFKIDYFMNHSPIKAEKRRLRRKSYAQK